MFPHPVMVHSVSDLRRQELLNAVARERQAVRVGRPTSEWQSLAVRVLALVTLALGLRG